MNRENDDLRAFHGIDTWHKKGYTGKGMIAGLGEDFTTGDKRSHAYSTFEVLKEIAPDCDVAYISENGVQDENYMREQTDLMRELGVCAWGTSNGLMKPDDDPISAEKAAPFERVKDFCTCVCAIGNDYDEAVVELSKAPYVYGIGAIKLLYGEPTPESFSSYSADNLDFCACDRWTVTAGDMSGTSFSSPAVEGLIILINQFFKAKTGKTLGSDAMYRFLKDCAVDFWDKGKDAKTGWGYIVLPDPDSINVAAYADVAPAEVPAPGDAEIDAKVALASDWAQKSWRKAMLKGVTDGTTPRANITREQVITMLDRLGLLE